MRVERIDQPVDPLRLVAHPELAEAGAITVEGWTVVVGEPLWVLTDLADLDALDDHLRGMPLPPAGGPPFAAGAVGWMADDLAPALLDLSVGPRRDPAATSGLRFGVHDSAVCIAPDGRALVTTSLRHAAAESRIRRWRSLVRSAPPLPPLGVPRARPAQLSLEPAAHAAAVRRAQGWIAAGDLYQLNLTLQVAVGWDDGAAVLAARLRAASSGSAHAAWLRQPDLDVVSVSPETFLRRRNERVVTRPIKGTRPRRADPVADRREAAALAASAKDHAEHVMIVDLERNDLGRVSLPGSVEVPELAALEQHPTVWHLTSTVHGRLRRDVSTRQLVEAMFPPGSVTGAPKRMAWARIAELEPVERGVYCGAVGMIGPAICDLSVAIRTVVLAGGVASYGTGGGIVADSDPAGEFDEAMDKAQAFALATGADLPPTAGRRP